MANLKREQLEIISKETIKPSTPTPSHLKTYKLSLLDQLISPIYIPFILFYPNVNNSPLHLAATSTQKSSLLKKSLSKTLTHYYPFAGRVAGGGTTVDCNDEGVVFVDARMKNLELSDLLGESVDGETLNLLFPAGYTWKDSCNNCSLIAIQVTFFDCGGMAVGACISHKIADGSSKSTFLSDWTAVTPHSQLLDDQEVVPSPTFISTYDNLPLLNAPATSTVPEIVFEQKQCATRRFSFDSSKIAKLKKTMNATPVEVVTAFIYKCATATATSTAEVAVTKAKEQLSVLIQMVDMRERVVPHFQNFV